MTIFYLHNNETQVSFEEGSTGEMCISFMQLDSAEPMETHIVSKEEARQVYAALRTAHYHKGMANQPVNVKPIKEKLDHAYAHGVKNPKMRVDGFCFTRAKDNSKNPGCVYVKAGPAYEATYYGKITRDGVFMPSYDCTRDVEARLAAVTADVVAAAKAYGQKTGTCSFCARELTHKNSILLSMGPYCAERYGMPHSYEPGAFDHLETEEEAA